MPEVEESARTKAPHEISSSEFIDRYLINEDLPANDIDIKLWSEFGKRFSRIFSLPSFDAPGLFLVGALVDTQKIVDGTPVGISSTTGKGLSQRDAVLSCIGEAVEVTSQHMWGDEPLVDRPDHSELEGDVERFQNVTGYKYQDKKDEFPWVIARKFHDGADVLLPAPLFFRGAEAGCIPTLSKPGLGCGSGPSTNSAFLHGLLELIERDALALWWAGGLPSRSIDISAPDLFEVRITLEMLRQNTVHKTTVFLDITTNLQIPTVVAVSHNADGHGLAFGFATRMTLPEACNAALIELTQMEMAVQIVQLKIQQQGQDALNDGERMVLRRYRELDLACIETNTPSVFLSNIGENSQGVTGNGAPNLENAQQLSVWLNRFNINVYGLNITRRSIGIPAVKLVSPDLQPFPSSFVTSRLLSTISEYGSDGSLKKSIEII